MYFRSQRQFKSHQGEMLSSTSNSEFSMQRDLVFVTDGSHFQPSLNNLENGRRSTSFRNSRMYCQLINPSDKHTQVGVSDFIAETRICDSRCDCYDCSDEDEKFCYMEGIQERLLSSKVVGLPSSPTLDELSDSGFWKILKIPSNGSTSLRIPFVGGPHRQLQLDAIVVGSRGKNRPKY